MRTFLNTGTLAATSASTPVTSNSSTLVNNSTLGFLYSKQRFFSATSTEDSIDSNIPKLPILWDMADTAKKAGIGDLSKIAVIGVQHMLPTTGSLIDVMIDGLNINPKNMYFTGKFYSSCPGTEEYIKKRGVSLMRTKIPRKPAQYREQMLETVGDMWDLFQEKINNNGIDAIAIFDEGGYLLESMPKSVRYKYRCSVIEQTTFGLHSHAVGSQLFPLIDVAKSVAKKQLESPLIATAILQRVEEIVVELKLKQNTIFGVIGNGSIGSAITQHLLSHGFTVVIYDESDSAFHGIINRNCYRVDNIKKVIAGANVVFSCTGKDVTRNVDIFDIVNDPITLISCSSQDIEFQSFLTKMSRRVTLHFNENATHITCSSNSGHDIKILNNGFPINFDKTAKSDPPQDMQLTRALLLGGLIQGATEATKPVNDGYTLNKSAHHMLNPYIQQFVVNRWQHSQPEGRYSKELLDCFNNIAWIKKNSSGEYKDNPLLGAGFSDDLSIEQEQEKLPVPQF
jgi:S-adenosylhomocysteine hydrolase